MEHDDLKARLAEITAFQEAALTGWPFFCAELDRIERELVERLITQESEATRGQIKLLRQIKELPETLQAEREGITKGLPE